MIIITLVRGYFKISKVYFTSSSEGVDKDCPSNQASIFGVKWLIIALKLNLILKYNLYFKIKLKILVI